MEKIINLQEVIMYVYKVEFYNNRHHEAPTIIRVVGESADDALKRAQEYNECMGLNYRKINVNPRPIMWVLV